MPRVRVRVACAWAASRPETRCTPGDKSSDLSWYSKRATLGAVYTAVELFMLTGSWLRGVSAPCLLTPRPCSDVSPEFEETWAFLDRSLRGAAEAGKAVSELSLVRCGLCWPPVERLSPTLLSGGCDGASWRD